jgi:hypothetical protein
MEMSLREKMVYSPDFLLYPKKISILSIAKKRKVSTWQFLCPHWTMMVRYGSRDALKAYSSYS